MKKIILSIIALFTLLNFYAQAPEQMNYQAVARDLSGSPLVNTVVNLQFEILQGSSSGAVTYSETQSKTTNQFGLFTAEIGAGTINSGNFSTISWGTSAYFLRITVNGDVMPATQLLSVPYALFSKTSGNGPAGLDGLNCWDINGNGLQDATEDVNNDGVWNALDCKGDSGVAGADGIGVNWLGMMGNPIPAPNENDAYYNTTVGTSFIWNVATSTWDTLATNSGGTVGLTAGSGIDITGGVITSTADTSATNEFQTLSINATNDTVFLSNGGFIPLPSAIGDNWGADSVHTVGGNVSGSGTQANPLTIIDNDTSLTNELQNLSWNTTDSNIINLSNGTGIPLSSNTPAANQVLTWNGANWVAQSLTGTGLWTQGTGADVYNNTDSIGIGVVDPKALLHVAGGGIGKPIALFEKGGFLNATININNTASNGSGINFQNGGTTTSSITSSTANVLSLTSDFVEVGNSPKTGKLNIASTSSLANPSLLLHETSTGFSRIKHTNTVAGGKYWVSEAGINATDANSGYSISYFDGANANNTFIVYGDKKVGINNLAAPLASFHVMEDSGTQNGIASEGFGNAGQVVIARNNFASPNRGAVQNGNEIGRLSFSGYGTSIYGNGPQIRSIATENFTNTANGSELIFSTVANGSVANVDALKILNNGTVEVINNFRLLNGAGTAGQVLTSDAAGNATWQTASGGANDTSLIDADGDTHINVEAAPDQDVIHFNLGNSTGYPSAEYFTMIGPRLEVINSGRSVFMGEGAGTNSNIATNRSAVAIGYNALNANVSGNFGVAIGAYSQQNATGSNNVSVGRFTLSSVTSATNLTAIGSDALRFNTSGSENTAVGVGASGNNTSGANNTSVGYVAGGNTDVGAFNTSIGGSALLYNISGNSNTAVGYLSLINTTANNNVGLGRGTGLTNTIGTDNTFLGYGADASVNNLTNATAIGANSIVSQSNSLILGNNANVGIGTNTPSEKLEVIGYTKTDSLRVLAGAGTAGQVLTSDAAGNATWQAAGGGSVWNLSGTDIHYTAGNVGIGTASPTSPLTINTIAGSEIAFLGISNADISAPSQLNLSSGNTTVIDASSILLRTAFADRLSILNNGNVGIGTGSPTALLDVRGSLFFPNAGTPGANKVLTSDATGNATWQSPSSGASIYSGSGSLSGATTVTQAANTLTFNSTTTNGFNIQNNVANNTVFNVENLTDGTPGTPAGSIGAKVLVSAANTERTGVFSGVTGTGTANQVAVWATAEGVSSGFNRGVLSNARNSTNTNIAGDFTASGNTGENIGLRVSLGGTGAGDKYGLRISSAGTTTGNLYGLYMVNNGSGTKYGVYSFGEDRNYFDGNVGIGTATPTAKLDVRGSLYFPNAGTPGANKVLTSDASGNATWQTPASGASFWNGSAGSVYLATAGDYVGLGGTSPGTKLDIYGASTSTATSGYWTSPETTIKIHNSDQTNNNFSALTFATTLSNSSNSEMGRLAVQNVDHTIGSESGDFVFSARNAGAMAEKMRIKGTGNVGIGTANPAAKLDVIGKLKVTDGTQGAGKILVSDATGVAAWKTNQIAFESYISNALAVNVGGFGAAINIVSFDLEIMDDGNVYDPSPFVNEFVASVNGVYAIEVGVTYEGIAGSDNIVELGMIKNGSATPIKVVTKTINPGERTSATISATIRLAAGDQIRIESILNSAGAVNILPSEGSWFSGHLIYEQ
ncbi:MAG: beta strand repeat-containing protein [Vicingaceae bacterium]